MLDLDQLSTSFVNHVRTLRSGTFACSVLTALEGWFRVELVPALEDLGINRNAIDSRFTYPGTQQQADLAVRTAFGLMVFEFMHFVSHKDSKKVKRLPGQLNRLEDIIRDGIARQGIAFLTFNGYSERRQNTLINGFFGERHWQIVGPIQVITTCPLLLVLAGFPANAAFRP